MRKEAIFDLDGVVADFVGGAISYCERILNKKVPPTWIGHTLDNSELKNLLSSEDFYTQLSPLPNVAEVFQWLIDSGYYIIVVTGRPITIGPTTTWMIKNRIPFSTILNRTKYERIELARRSNPEIFVDDNMETALAVKDYCYFTAVMQRPWNSFGGSEVHSLKDLTELYLHIGGVPNG